MAQLRRPKQPKYNMGFRVGRATRCPDRKRRIDFHIEYTIGRDWLIAFATDCLLWTGSLPGTGSVCWFPPMDSELFWTTVRNYIMEHGEEQVYRWQERSSGHTTNKQRSKAFCEATAFIDDLFPQLKESK